MPVEKRSQRLQVVVDIAEQAEHDAAQQFESAKAALQKELSALADVDEYYADYQKKFSTQKAGLRAADLMKSRDFLTRLASMRDAQRLKVDLAERDLQQARGHWHQHHLKHKGLKELVANYRHDEFRELDVLEQKNLDEWVSLQR